VELTNLVTGGDADVGLAALAAGSSAA